jgi:ubiquinone/menaquinone biosynthesis C-methylase UbiE
MQTMPTSEEVKAYFDRVAPTWDTMRQDYYGVAVIDKAVAAAGLDQQPVDLLVDAGCGTGFLTAGLAPLARRVIGVDDSPGMLAVARENMRALGLANVELQQGSVDSLPLDANQAGATFANMVLHHAPDPQRMVREMARVTRPGGRVVITDMDRHTHEWFRVEMADVWLGFTEAQVRAYFQGAGLVAVAFGWVDTQ